MTINTAKDCPECKWSILDESNKARVTVTCRKHCKVMYYGKVMDCDDKDTDKDDTDEMV